MKILLPLLTLALVFCLTATSAQSASPVWEISKGDHHLFIGGTIHVLTPQDYPLPAPFDEAYAQAGTLVFESDLQQFQSPEFQQVMFKKLRYPAGESLQQELSQETVRALQAYCLEHSVTFEEIIKFRPGMATMLLTIIELQRLRLFGAGVDAYYTQKGHAENKQMDYLETPQQQLAFLDSLGKGQEDQMITYSLEDNDHLAEIINELKKAWRVGDVAALNALSNSAMAEKFPEIYQTLLIERNQAWMSKIESMLRNDEVEFVMVGALHLVGNQGVLKQLEARGYTIKML